MTSVLHSCVHKERAEAQGTWKSDGLLVRTGSVLDQWGNVGLSRRVFSVDDQTVGGNSL